MVGKNALSSEPIRGMFVTSACISIGVQMLGCIVFKLETATSADAWVQVVRLVSHKTYKTYTHLDKIVSQFVMIIRTFERDLRTDRWSTEVAGVLVRGPEGVCSTRIAVTYREVVVLPEDAATHDFIDHSSSLGISEFRIPKRGLVYFDHLCAQFR